MKLVTVSTKHDYQSSTIIQEINMKETFEQFLQRMHMEDEPMILDDDLPDAYEAWVSDLGVELLIAYAEKWHTEQLIANLTK